MKIIILTIIKKHLFEETLDRLNIKLKDIHFSDYVIKPSSLRAIEKAIKKALEREAVNEN